MMNGFLVIDKPTGRTSSDVVVRVRRRLPKGTAIGHAGTLDPDASGVLPLMLGKATRLFDYVVDKRKTYVAELQLGVETDTQDASGQVVAEKPVLVDEAALKAVLPALTGDILQVPPMYSALKQGGQRLYKLARKGETVERPARPCHVDDIRLLENLGGDRYRIRVDCGKGVYIRTLCYDIGQALGCGAHMASLRRTAAGIFTLGNAHTLQDAEAALEAGTLEELLLPLDAPLGGIPRVRVDARAEHAVRNGNPLKPQWLTEGSAQPGETVRVYLEEAFAGMGEGREDGTIRFRAMLLEGKA